MEQSQTIDGELLTPYPYDAYPDPGREMAPFEGRRRWCASGVGWLGVS